MKSTILIILTVTTIEVAAQNHLAGIRGGVNWTNVTGNILNQSGYRQGVSGGITYEYFLKKRFSIGTDLIYNERGVRADGATPTGEKTALKFNYDYLSVPVKAGFYTGNKVVSFAKAGLIPSLLINAKTITPTFDTDGSMTGTQIADVTKSVSKFDLAALGEIGAGYKITDRLLLIASFVFQHSLTSITNAAYFANRNIRHNGISLHIGLSWALKKE